jgi:putative ABC transport system permease protein
VDRPLLLLGILLGTGGATVSALWPAREATRVQPVVALRGAALGSIEQPLPRLRLADALIVLLLLGAWPVSQLPPFRGLPVPGYVAIAQVLLAALLFTPRALLLTAGILERPLVRVLGIEGHLACANLRRNRTRSAVTVGALLISVSTVTSLAVLLGSFERSTLKWMNQTMPADLFITSASPFAASTKNSHMSPELYEPLRSIDGVEAVNRVRIVDLDYRSTGIKLVSFDWPVEKRYGSFTFLAGDAAAADAAMEGEGGVLASENFARRFGAGPGSTLTLMAPGGPRELRIAAVVVDYTSDQGALFLSRATYSKVWQDSRVDTYKMHLRKGADLERARRRVQELFGQSHTLFVLSNAELKQEVKRVLSQTFQLTDALQMVALLIAALGIVNTLLAAVLDRMREIGVLRAIGALRQQVRRVIVIEALLLGLCSGVVGIACGLLSGEILLRAVNTVQSGWLWQFAFPVAALLRLLGLVLLAAALAGWFPARQAARLPIIRSLKYE